MSSGATSKPESQPEALTENMLDMTSADQPEVWEEKAKKLQTAPELPVVSGAVTFNKANTRSSQIMEAPPDLGEDKKKKKDKCVIA